MLQIGYHENFKFRTTLLFAGSASEISWLLKIIEAWDGEVLDLIEALSKENELALDGVTSITLSKSKAEKDSYVEWGPKGGVWRISRRGQPRIVGMLGALKNSAHPGHQYLDIGDPKGIQIMCSKDEYPNKST